MNEHDVDRSLHEAGARLRRSAPDAAATEAALDRSGGSPRRWWVVPVVVATAAAAVLAVVVTTRTDETVRQVPADTGVSAPTSSVAQTTTLPPTSTAPPTPTPAFVGSLPLEVPAAIIGCPGSFGQLAEAVPDHPITAVGCADRAAAAVTTANSTVNLRWTGSGWEPGTAAIPTRPLPPAWLVEDDHYRPGSDSTDELAGLGLEVAGDPMTFAAELAARLAAITEGDPVPRSEWAVLEGVPVVAVTLRGIPDDSSSRLTYVVRYADNGGVLAPTDGLRFMYCDRGVTTDGLCL